MDKDRVKRHVKKRLGVALGLLYGLAAGTPLLADDTEIFFGGSSATAGTVLPNVLLILDTSSSMTSKDGGPTTRLDRMKEALRQILDSATNINVGMMRFSGGNSGGPVLFPVKNIDQDVCEIEPCDDSGPNIQVRVSSSADDAEEASDGSVNLTSTDLELVTDPAVSGGTENTLELHIQKGEDDVEEYGTSNALYTTSSDLEFVYDSYKGDHQRIGLRFPNVSIPPGAIISEAELEFTVDVQQGGDISLDIYGHAHDNAPVFQEAANLRVSDRLQTSRVDWDNLPNPGSGAKLTSPDIKNIVQEIVNRPGWSDGNAMAFMLFKDPDSPSGSSNKREVNAKQSSIPEAERPTLRVTYMTGSGLSDPTQTVGLRFRNVQIPQGATITSASLEFEVDSADSEATSLAILGEDSDNPASFTDSTHDITGRPITSNTVVWSDVEAWTTVGEKKLSPDITSVVQEIVDRTGWCGGNAMAFLIEGTGRRTAKSYDGASGDAPLLKITYDPDSIPAGGGCLNQTIIKRVTTGADDAEEKVSDNTVNTGSSDLELVSDGGDQLIGIRFQSLQIPQGATVLEASLEFEIDEAGSDAISLDISGEAHDDAAIFSSADSDISSRNKTAASVTWSNLPDAAVDQKIESPDVTAIVQEIVNRSGWASGNDMAFIIEKQSGSGKRVVESHNGESGAAPRLTVKIQWQTGGTEEEGALLTVRERLRQEVDNLEYKSGTPIVDAFYEGARYFRGEVLDYGVRRGYPSSSRREYTRVSHPASYEPNGSSVVREAGCTDDNLNATECRSEQIVGGSPKYISPITETCQTNHIVLLSDGYPSSNSSAAKVKTMADINSCADSGNAECGPELAKFLYENDQVTGLDGNQTITTHTIGFNFTGPWLKSVATEGGGSFYEANSAAELATAFETILKDIAKVDSSFVSPGATVNQFNRLSHRNEIYFSLFKPDERPQWTGNLKRYKLHGNPAEIVDVTDAQAIDNASGFFKSTAQSFWSPGVDGNDVSAGGVASQLSLSGRKVYTHTGNSDVLSDPSNELSETNSAITKSLLGIDAEDDAYRTSLLQWARGVDLNDADEDNDTTDIRPQIGDPLHSRPIIVNYGGTETSPDATVYFATNQGFLYAIDPDDGREVFSFIPQELLSNLNVFYTNSSASKHPYGLDGAITAWVTDSHKYLYIGMRRGGRNYYALDVSDRDNPRILWTIHGGTDAGFEELGQTWSRPIFTQVKLGGTERHVLIFAGGYDDDQDTHDIRTVDSEGRAIFMVDAATGDLIWSGGSDDQSDSFNPTKQFEPMKYSIPSDIRVIDVNGDHLADQMYVGDMGGQVWRFDIKNGATSASEFVNGGVLARLSGTDAANNRRFYYPPDVALLHHHGDSLLSVSIGSGWRAHPLNTVIEDRFYMIKNTPAFHPPAGYGKEVSGIYVPYEEADLYDATANLIGQGTDTEQADAQTLLKGKSGWYMRLGTGEKVLASSLTINNQVLFTTYIPGAANSACSAVLGGGRFYLVSVFDATPRENLDETGDDQQLIAEDRSKELHRGGVPPEPKALFPDGSDPIVLIGTEKSPDFDFGKLTNRTFWREDID